MIYNSIIVTSTDDPYILDNISNGNCSFCGQYLFSDPQNELLPTVLFIFVFIWLVNREPILLFLIWTVLVPDAIYPYLFYILNIFSHLNMNNQQSTEKINWESTVTVTYAVLCFAVCAFPFSIIVLKQTTNKVYGVNRLLCRALLQGVLKRAEWGRSL